METARKCGPEMATARKCSLCGHNGHNTRSCQKKGPNFRLFGVNIDLRKEEEKFNEDEDLIRKSKSLGNLQASSNNVGVETGYLSDDHLHSSKRRKGTSWTEDEHRRFLTGLKKLGKGNWREISRDYVKTRNATQVASHAQKYFIRLESVRKKRRLSVFDMPLREETPSLQDSPPQEDPEVSLRLSVSPPNTMETTTSNIQEQASTSISPSGAVSEKSPLSPVAQNQDLHTAPHMVGYHPSMAPRFIEENNYPNKLLLGPVMNSADRNSHLYQFDSYVALATGSPFINHLVQPLLPNGMSEAAEKDKLDDGIGILPLFI